MSATIQHAAPIATAAKLFCGFSDPTRLAIITTLADGEQRVSDIVTALNGSQGNISNVEIFNNATGILVSTSQASVGGGNFIHHNREHGVLAQAGAVLGVNGSKIQDNGQIGVFGYLGATVVMGSNEITDNGGTGAFCMNGSNIGHNADHRCGQTASAAGTCWRPSVPDRPFQAA